MQSFIIIFLIFRSFWTFGLQYCKNESIHLNSWNHSHKKQKDGLETQVVFVDILNYFGVIVQRKHQNSEQW